MKEVIIRHAEPSDYQPVITVVDEWWGGRPMTAMLPRLFFVHFRPTSFVAEHNGKIVAFLIGFISQTHPEEAYIHFAGVHPEFRKGGLGQTLYRRFFATAKDLGCHTVQCVTSPLNKGSIAFHRHMGFAPRDSEKLVDGIPAIERYDGPGEDRVVFLRTLNDSIS